jgi:hypothetical protein
MGHASQEGSRHQSHRKDAFSFYPYCLYDRDNGHVYLYLVLMSLISLHQSLQLELL